MNHICHLGYKSHKNNTVYRQIIVTQQFGRFKSVHHKIGYNSLVFRQKYDRSVFFSGRLW